MKEKTSTQTVSWLDKPVFSEIKLTWESVLFGVILLLAIVSRFYDLGTRVISHDETSHVYYAWRLFQGIGYSHTPVTHGPLQFHLLAFIYFLLGDSDFTARIPAAIFSVATIAFLWKYRRYLGKYGTLAAAGMMLISPFMLYYGRYARNEAFCALFGLVVIWSILRYLETQAPRYLYWMTAVTMLHFTAKETSFIYTAQAMLFLGFYFVIRITKEKWPNDQYRRLFLTSLIVTAVFLGIAIVGNVFAPTNAPVAGEMATGEVVAEETAGGEMANVPSVLTIVSVAISALSLLAALIFAILGYTWVKLRALPSFGALLLLTTLVLPQLAPFPMSVMPGWNATDYSQSGMVRTGIVLIILASISIAAGLAWNPQVWLINAAIFYIPFTIFYTTFFTNGAGFFTGMVGSLGYWLKQQGVERGSQPWYYYWLIQIPLYEYLPMLISLFTFIGIVVKRLQDRLSLAMEEEEGEETKEVASEAPRQAPVLALLGFWLVTSLFAYPIAGEKMPWLTVHIAFPLILFSAWGLDKLISFIDFPRFREKHGGVIVLLTLVFFLSFFSMVGSLLGVDRPFQGQETGQLQTTNMFILSLLTTIASGVGIGALTKQWRYRQVGAIILLVAIACVGVLTIHTSVQAAYINYDNPTEYLVYAHAARGVKEALAQIEELSYRTSDGLAMEVSYDNETTYPYWWYLRNYDNQVFYGENPTRAQRSSPVILVGNDNYSKIAPVVGEAYYEFEYNRIWWPNQDYFNLTWKRVIDVLKNPAMREAIFKIWLNRDYSQYATLKERDMSLANWNPSDRMKLYVRKDIAAKVWNYGTIGSSIEEMLADPYEGKEITRSADHIFDGGMFNRPRNVATAPDGSIYVADSGNHRILHLSPTGKILHQWGSFGAVEEGKAEAGTFNEPWGIDVDEDGFVYVCDTWNHRIQKFTGEGEFVVSWGQFGQAETGDAFWGPRDIAVDNRGLLYVSDTGNKRIAVFDLAGNYITSFGEVGLGPGQFDEPTGLAIDSQGNLYVADTWNQRVQVFEPNEQGVAVNYKISWDITGWYGQSLDNKPYLAVDEENRVYISDPEGVRILVFTSEGQFLNYWGTFGAGENNFNLPTGLATDSEGNVWIADTANNRLLRFDPLEEQ